MTRIHVTGDLEVYPDPVPGVPGARPSRPTPAQVRSVSRGCRRRNRVAPIARTSTSQPAGWGAAPVAQALPLRRRGDASPASASPVESACESAPGCVAPVGPAGRVRAPGVRVRVRGGRRVSRRVGVARAVFHVRVRDIAAARVTDVRGIVDIRSRVGGCACVARVAAGIGVRTGVPGVGSPGVRFPVGHGDDVELLRGPRRTTVRTSPTR